ncbi:MAG: anti-sigma factor, partial [Pseudolabrys sp.]
MIDRDSPVTEDELHAYIDGELPADRKEAVATWLADHPEQAALVASWRAQAENIRARYGAVVEEPVPERLKLDQVLKHGRSNGRSWAAMVAAAAVVAFIVGGTAGWMARGASAAAPTGFDIFASEALDAYKLYVVEVRHPVEVPGSERAHMTQWLSKRLGQDLRVPDLQSIGLKLVGGRLLPGPTGAAAFYMYE